jgi:hyperosmotically inducible protein
MSRESMSRTSLLLGAAAASLVVAGCRPEPSAGTGPVEPASGNIVATTPSGEVRPGATGRAMDDAVLTTRVKSTLLAKSDLNAGDISVTSSGGQVTLTGQVPAEQITRADTVVRAVDGVVEVINALTPLPPQKTPPS